MYDVDANTLKQTYQHKLAVLDCCFTDLNHSYSGGLDATLKSFDFTAQKETIVGMHNDAIRCVHYCPDVNLVITGGWDNLIKLWDPRKFIIIILLYLARKFCLNL